MSASNKGGLSDYRMLHCGWAMADAVIFGAETLRDEPHVSALLSFDDLVTYRLQQGQSSLPIAVVLTSSGNINLLGPFFTEKLGAQFPPQHQCQRKLVFTTEEGRSKMLTTTASSLGIPIETLQDRLLQNQTQIIVCKAFTLPTGAALINFHTMLGTLHDDFGVKFVDIAAGPATIVQLLKLFAHPQSLIIRPNSHLQGN